ncbi:MAG TPA: pyridoxal kinase PdxY [Microlunatus sp.]|nr:pyridoxal kinase PdxY [Microlunatus sp.]
MTSILSIQSAVAYGHAGNSAATFPLMRMGVEVWPVLTVNFSNHTGYGAWRGPLIPPAEVAAVVTGIDERGVLDRCDAVLSGYQGSVEIGQVVLDAVDLVRSRNQGAVYCCDPVMGDVGRGFFVRPEIPAMMRDLVVPAADIVTPNQFELEFLTGQTLRTLDDVVRAARELRAAGPRTVLVTSVVADTAPDTVSMVAVTGDGAWSVTTPAIPQTFTGAGDVTSAIFLAHLLRGGDIVEALGATAAAMYGLLSATHAARRWELALVAAQDEFVAPTHHFEVTHLD